MFQNQDLRKMYGLKPQDLQYLFTGRFIEASDTISKGPRGRRVCDLKTTFMIGVLSSLRSYRVDFRVGHILMYHLEHILDDFQESITPYVPLSLATQIHTFDPFTHLEMPPLDFYLDFKDRKWLGIHLKIPDKSAVSYFDWAYKIRLIKEGRYQDEYHVKKVVLPENTGDVFWTDYETKISLNLTQITRKIKAYIASSPQRKFKI